ncbi:hypothetical protein D021_0226B, partial [Vibrio parahaemolyticus 10296]
LQGLKQKSFSLPPLVDVIRFHPDQKNAPQPRTYLWLPASALESEVRHSETPLSANHHHALPSD